MTDKPASTSDVVPSRTSADVSGEAKRFTRTEIQEATRVEQRDSAPGKNFTMLSIMYVNFLLHSVAAWLELWCLRRYPSRAGGSRGTAQFVKLRNIALTATPVYTHSGLAYTILNSWTVRLASTPRAVAISR